MKQCSVAKKCGGCQLQNLSYDEQLSLKQSKIIRMVGKYCHVDEIIGMEDPYRYRNKATHIFGFKSGKDTDKFEGIPYSESANGLAVLKNHVCAVLSLKVESTLDLGTHVLFVCELTDAEILNENTPMTYAYYHKNVKPQPKTAEKKAFVCNICGYLYEGESLPEDFICPWCKHPASDFEEQ